MAVTMKEYGPWDRFMMFPGRLAKGVAPIAERVINAESKKVAQALKNTIESGGAGGPGLTPGVVARKGHGIKLVDSHALAGSIEVDPTTVGSEGFVGIKNGVGHPTGISMTALATMHEFGTATIPPRPFLRPTLQKAGPRMVLGVIKYWNKMVMRIW